MGEFSIFHWLIVLAIVLIFFGGRPHPGSDEGPRRRHSEFQGRHQRRVNNAAATSTGRAGASAQREADRREEISGGSKISRVLKRLRLRLEPFVFLVERRV